MKSPFQCNPFAVEAWFDFSITLTFAVPRDELAARLPSCLEAESHGGRWAFLAIAFVQTRCLRPAGLPSFLGRDFVLAGYRHFVAYRSRDGRRLRGLQIIRSETDSHGMAFWGNLFTPYRYTHAPLKLERCDDGFRITDSSSGLDVVTAPMTDDQPSLPPGSPFATWKEARRFCGPMPFTFSHDARRRHVVIVEGVREHWQPAPLHVQRQHIPHLPRLGFSETRLACAFMVRDIPYHWKKGRREPCP